MRLFAIVVLVLVGCSSGGGPTFDAGSSDGGPPAPGVACPPNSRGSGACSEDGGELLTCSDAGWTKLDDCRGRGACRVDGTSVRCGNDGLKRCWEYKHVAPYFPSETTCRASAPDGGAPSACCTAGAGGKLVVSVCACDFSTFPMPPAPQSYCEDVSGACAAWSSDFAVTDGRYNGRCPNGC